ncbi:HAD-IIB family hydrolase [Clostridium neonatale]|uniref:HAD family hydrolase n=1 Tax=Clostridium neonatale TaxID=137838 RepID=UPI00314096C7
MIKLVVSDLDRTLLPHGVQEVDEQTIYTIKKLVEKNIYFAIASGRSYKELSKFMKKQKILYF